MTSKLNIAIAAGGTAGHVNPALALAEELRDRGHHVRFFGQTRRLEGALVPEAGFDFTPVEVSGFDRSRPWTLFTALAHIAREKKRLVGMFGNDSSLRPDVAIGFGAYVELPLVQAANKLGIPVALHEQNSVPGLANKRSAKKSALVAIAQPDVRSIFQELGAQNIVFTGNPVRASVLAGERSAGRARLGVADGETLLLVFGGSLGARHINQTMVRLKDSLLAVPGLRIVHSTGKDDYQQTVDALGLTRNEASRWDVRPYIDGMGDMLAAADLVLSRAGASSIAEISALAVPSVLIPYPHATADHQTTNARYLVDSGAAVMYRDDALDEPAFDEGLLSLLGDDGARAEMRERARALGQDRAAAKLADALLSLVNA